MVPNPLTTEDAEITPHEGKCFRRVQSGNRHTINSSTQMQFIGRVYQGLRLLPGERLLKQITSDFVDDQRSRTGCPKPEIWFCGDWVREKLLGTQTSEIDIANNMMAGIDLRFALLDFYTQHRAKYLEEARKPGISPSFQSFTMSSRCKTGSPHRPFINFNRVFQLNEKLVGVMEKTHAHQSIYRGKAVRKVGNDVENHERPTNALYYNVRTQRVEQFAGKSLKSMVADIIRTPISSHRAFAADNSRILRLIMLVIRFGYAFDEVRRGARNKADVLATLKEEANGERVGTGLVNMINGEDSLMAFPLIEQAGFYPASILNSTDREFEDIWMFSHHYLRRPNANTWTHAMDLLTRLLLERRELEAKLSGADGKYYWTMSTPSPDMVANRTFFHIAKGKMKENLKSIDEASKALSDALKHMDHIQATVDAVDMPLSRRGDMFKGKVGLAIRSWGPNWGFQLLYTILAVIIYDKPIEGLYESLLGRYVKFMVFVLREDLQDAAIVEPILNGKDIVELFER